MPDTRQSKTEPASKDDANAIDDSILGTAKIDPDAYKASTSNTSRLESFKYALAGLVYMFRRERSTRLLVALTILVVVLCLWLEISMTQFALCLISVGMVWMGEVLNSAIEAVVDLSVDGLHPLAKVAKDVGSTATLIATIVALVVNLMILLPPLLEQLG